MARIVDSWLENTTRVTSPNCDSRPDGVEISLVVIHCISLPKGSYGNDLVEQLFTNRLDTDSRRSLRDLKDVRVSAHLYISRCGDVTQFVPFERRAWHAGVSSFGGRENCNDYSIGIELEGTDEDTYTDVQYKSLIDVVAALVRTYPRIDIRRIVGHSEVARGRKSDPGPLFDWQRLYSGIRIHLVERIG